MTQYRSSAKRVRTLSDLPATLLVFVICLSCWVAGYVYSVGFPVKAASSIAPFWETLCNSLESKTPVYVAGMLFMLLTAFIMQRVSDYGMLTSKRTSLSFLIFVILICTNHSLIPFNEATIAVLCLSFMVMELFYTYQQPEATGSFFNMGVSIGVSTLFIPQVLLVFPLLWAGAYQFRSLSLKSILASIVGTLTIFWLVFGWCMWKHDFSMFDSLFSTIVDFNLITIDVLIQYHNAGSIFVVILLLLASLNIKMEALNNSVRVRNMLSFLLSMFFWSLLLIFIYGRHSDWFLAILYLPASILLAYYFENMRQTLRFIIYYFMFLLLVLSFIMRIWI